MDQAMKSQELANMTPDAVKSIFEIIGATLESARHAVQEQIRHYPPPIPGCDADFNYLLAARARIGDELNRLQQTVSENVTPEESMTLIEEFMRSSAYITEETKREIWSRLNKWSSRNERRT